MLANCEPRLSAYSSSAENVILPQQLAVALYKQVVQVFKATARTGYRGVGGYVPFMDALLAFGAGQRELFAGVFAQQLAVERAVLVESEHGAHGHQSNQHYRAHNNGYRPARYQRSCQRQTICRRQQYRRDTPEYRSASVFIERLSGALIPAQRVCGHAQLAARAKRRRQYALARVQSDDQSGQQRKGRHAY